MKRRVVKVGGSLLEVSNLAAKLNAWLTENGDMQNVIVVGGGGIVDVLRNFQTAHNFTDRQSHELACKAMSVTAKIVDCFLTDAIRCENFVQLQSATSETVVFDSSAWILQKEDVPASWDFTSDSIAARLASELDADELVLIKSRVGSIDEPGFVDECFAAESQSVKSIRVCTLNE